MTAILAIKIARLSLLSANRIEYNLKLRKAVAVGFTKQDTEAADAYNRLSELARMLDGNQ